MHENPGAARSVDAGAVEAIVYQAIRSFPKGCIPEQVYQALPQFTMVTVSPRFATLKNRGLIVDTGFRRMASSGRSQRVLKAVS